MKHSKELKIGIFAVVVIVVSFFVINYLRGKDIFNKEITVVSRFDNVEGLVASAPVMIRGYKAGMVSSVEYLPEDDVFEVKCSVDKSFRIPKDSKMTIYSTSIMGGKGIMIESGSSDTLSVNGTMLQGDSQKDLVETLSGGIEPLITSLGDTLDELKTAVANVNSILDEDTTSDIKKAVSELRSTMKNVKVLTDTLRNSSPELSAFVASLASVSSQLESIADKADKVMGSAGNVVGQLEEADIDGLVKSVKDLSDKIQSPDGTVGKLLNENDVYNSADSLINQINDLVSKIKENPKKYLKISVF